MHTRSEFCAAARRLRFFVLLVVVGVISLPCAVEARRFARVPKFLDVTRAVQLHQRPHYKWGGPCVADLDNDGRYDMILSYHNDARLEIWFGNPNGTFSKKEDFIQRQWDVHGVTVAPRSARSRDRLISVSVGGGEGTHPKPPFMYQMSPHRLLTNLTYAQGFGKRRGRGRTSVFMDLALRKNHVRRRLGGGPDMLFFSYRGSRKSKIKQFAYQNRGRRFALRRAAGIANVMYGPTEVTDNDGDGVMEVIAIRELRIFKLYKAFHFRDITDRVLPPLEYGGMTVSAVVEFDYDNDGDFDLYIARTNRTFISNRVPLTDKDSLTDFLLENRDGQYYDVSAQARIPRGTHSQGVTAGDLNNDGYTDLVVVQYRKRDIVLLNNGDGTFKRVGGLIPKRRGTVGNQAVAVDYDMDGRVDIAVGHGERDRMRGTYHLMRNVLWRGGRHYLLVRVLNEPRRTTTALHALVSVKVRGVKGVLTQRVGSRGAQMGGGSFLDTVHFGLGRARRVIWVRVRWTSGMVRTKWKVRADRKISFGVL